MVVCVGRWSLFIRSGLTVLEKRLHLKLIFIFLNLRLIRISTVPGMPTIKDEDIIDREKMTGNFETESES
jgi:hypothetical protein